MGDYSAVIDNSPSITTIKPLVSPAASPTIHEVRVEEPGTLKSSVFNLTNTILGAGLLAIPWTFYRCGIIITFILFAVAWFASRLGLILLVKCSHELVSPENRQRIRSSASYAQGEAEKGLEESDAAEEALPPQEEPSFSLAAKSTFPVLLYYTDFIVFIKCFGVATAYLIVVGDLMPEVFQDFWPSEDDQFYAKRDFWISVAIVIIFPMCVLLQKLDSLKFTSILALGTVVYLSIAVVAYYFYSKDDSDHQDLGIQMADFNYKVFSAFPIVVFSFTCHQNIFPIYKELNKEKYRIEHVINISTLTCLTTYVIVGLFAYLTWGDDTDSDVLKSYPSNTTFTIAKIGVVILVIFSYPLQAFPCRYSAHNLICKLRDVDPAPYRGKLGPVWSGEMILILAISYGTALLVDDLGVVFGVIGATGSSSVSYLLPGLFYLKLTEKVPFKEDWYRVGALGLVMGGIFILIVGNVTVLI